jgi:hypothetical protein
VLAWLYFRKVMTDITFIRMVEPQLNAIRCLNETIQSTFRQRAAEKRCDTGKGRFFDQLAIPVLAELNAALIEPADNIQLEFQENCERLERLASLLLALLNPTGARGKGNCSLLGDLENRLS